MIRRSRSVSLCVGFLLVFAGAVYGQGTDLTSLRRQSSFTPADTDRIEEEIEQLVQAMVSGRTSEEVNRARNALTGLVDAEKVSQAFREKAASITAEKLASKVHLALAQKNRLAAAIVAARLQNPESVLLLLKLIGEDEHYPSVRYWAAKGLATQELRDAILKGRGNVPPIRVVVEDLEKALEREPDVICTGSLFEVLGVLKTESAADVLVKAVGEKAKQFDLSRREAVDAMVTGVEGLKAAYDRAVRAPEEGKRPIVATLAQVLVQTPPHGHGLKLILRIHEILGELTQQETGLSEAVQTLRDSDMEDPKLIDTVWLQQLNWIETLLAAEETEAKLLSRPDILAWSPEKSADVVREAANEE